MEWILLFKHYDIIYANNNVSILLSWEPIIVLSLSSALWRYLICYLMKSQKSPRYIYKVYSIYFQPTVYFEPSLSRWGGEAGGGVACTDSDPFSSSTSNPCHSTIYTYYAPDLTFFPITFPLSKLLTGDTPWYCYEF